MTTEVKPMTADEAARALPALRGYTEVDLHVHAIADGRHVVVEREELEFLYSEIERLSAAAGVL